MQLAEKTEWFYDKNEKKNDAPVLSQEIQTP
jgi:hypothetical protein